MAFSPDGRTLATVGNDRTVRLWDAGCRAAILQLGLESPVTTLAWGEEGIAVGTVAGEVVLLAVIDRDGPTRLGNHNRAP